MVQNDAGNYCTCFLFMKPTANIKQLLERWMRSIVEHRAFNNQVVRILACTPHCWENAPTFGMMASKTNLHGSLERREY